MVTGAANEQASTGSVLNRRQLDSNVSQPQAVANKGQFWWATIIRTASWPSSSGSPQDSMLAFR